MLGDAPEMQWEMMLGVNASVKEGALLEQSGIEVGVYGADQDGIKAERQSN